MSYPPDRYLGDEGEVSARFRPANAEPELPSRGGRGAHYLATVASTHGLFGLHRWDMMVGRTSRRIDPDAPDLVHTPFRPSIGAPHAC